MKIVCAFVCVKTILVILLEIASVYSFNPLILIEWK